MTASLLMIQHGNDARWGDTPDTQLHQVFRAQSIRPGGLQIVLSIFPPPPPPHPICIRMRRTTDRIACTMMSHVVDLLTDFLMCICAHNTFFQLPF